MKFLNKARQFASNKYTQAGVAMVVSGSAAAEDSANVVAIKEAIASGEGMVNLTTSGVIGVAALGFAVGMVVMWLRR